MAREKFPSLICRPIAAQFVDANLIALFEFAPAKPLLKIQEEKHYRLVSPDQLSREELEQYRELTSRSHSAAR